MNNCLKFASTVLATFVLLCACNSVASSQLNSHEQEVCRAFQAGQIVVLIGPTQPDDSEWYADWSAYLNDFVTAHHSEIVVEHAKQLPTVEVASHTVLFSHKAHSDFVVQEAVEPQYYEYVWLTYNGLPRPEHVQSFAPLKVNRQQLAKLCESIR